jgi:LEA14-like dessication related protein
MTGGIFFTRKIENWLNLLCGLWLLLILCTACAGKPAAPETPPDPAPVPSLGFDRIEARDPEHISLYFLLRVENPRPDPISINMENWTIMLNNRLVEEGVLVNLEKAWLESRNSGTFPVRIDLESPALLPSEADVDVSEYELRVRLDMDFVFEDGDSFSGPVLGEARFPRIRGPVFTITAITVMRAELINTRLKVSLRIDNPNDFELALSSFAYELYGSGRFWANGILKDVMRIAGQGSVEQDLFLIMNFINMKRDLLDQVIALQTVHYRFSGESAVSTGIDYLPKFRINFDRIGESPVIE